MGLYGEVELGKSRGHTAVCSPVFVRPNLLCYVSGNCINAVDTGHFTPIERTVPEATVSAAESSSESGLRPQRLAGHISPETHNRIVVADAQISAFAVYARDGVVAYVESGSSKVKVAKWSISNGITTPMGELEAVQDLQILALTFSADGQYLAALGDLPSYQITIWNWRAQKAVANCSNDAPACSISFDPLDSKRLCTSGRGGVIKFWKLKVGFRKHLLLPTVGAEMPKQPIVESETPVNLLASLRFDTRSTVVEEHEPIKVVPLGHTWSPAHKVYCSSDDGCEIYLFDPETGACDIVVSTKRDVTFLEPMQLSSEQPEADKCPSGSMRCVAINAHGFIVGGQDGALRIVTSEGAASKVINVTGGVPISNIVVSPDFKQVIVEAQNTRIFLVNLQNERNLLVVNSDTHSIVAVGTYVLFNKSVTISANGLLQFWDIEKQTLMTRVATNSTPSCLAVSPISYLIGIGSTSGHVRIYDTSGIPEKPPRLVFRKRVHSGCVKKVSFESGGRYMMSAAEDGHVFLYDVFEKFKVMGYLMIAGTFSGAMWNNEELDDKPAFLRLYVLSREEQQQSTLIYRFELPLDQELTCAGDEPMRISKSLYQQIVYKIEDHITDIAVLPSHLSAGRETFYLLTGERKLKVVMAPSNPTLYTDHQRSPALLSPSNTREWLLTWAPDGLITIRSLIEPERSIKLYAHDPHQGGVRDAIFSRDCRFIITAGGDGLLRRWDWRYSTGGRRVALEAAENAENLADERRPVADDITARLAEMFERTPVTDQSDSVHEDDLLDSLEKSKRPEVHTSSEKDTYRAQIESKVKGITEKLLRAMEKNETVPQLEQIDREEFIVDFEERDRLISEADAKIRGIRREIEEENLKKHVIRNRLKKECWDSMEVVGQSIKSFNKETMTNRLTEAPNYPIRHRSKAQLRWVEKMKRLRRVQIAVHNATRKKSVHEESAADEQHAEEGEAKKVVQTQSKNSELLYDPFELTTNERRRIQSVLLGEYILDIKTEFNARFNEMFKLKQDEIVKIEEKNDRINTILQQLQLQEAVYHPELDEDEVPTRIIEVLDSEVTCERFITAEERKRIEEKRRQEEERQRQQAEDNSRQRALMTMMGGKLEDRTEQDNKVELVKPEWMNKPKADMTDEERKLLKEFEKKMAIFKARLARDSFTIGEICDGFDTQLREFYRKKLATDQAIYQCELRMIKLAQAEFAIQRRLEDLRQEKTMYTNEIPEIKKELEKYREEYESALKRDKEIERLFKKEFHGSDFFYEALLRLFKRRDGGRVDKEEPAKAKEEDWNPFAAAERDQGISEADPPPLNQDVDMPEGLPLELWNKLVDLRDKKIATEQEVLTTSRKFNDMQTLVQNVLEESDRIRTESEKTANELAQFLEYKFQNTYNLDSLFNLKQGQVEVPQAPVVTDYSDALLIHRSAVERLNDSIVALGKAKVDALTEMKDYRKGIHALEWENKMFDYQAEDLVIRTRDIQLLRVTKQMQEYIRSGDEHKQATEIAALEKRAEYSQKAHLHKIEEKKKTVQRLQKKIREKVLENQALDTQLRELDSAVMERRNIHDVKLKRASETRRKDPLREIYTRRRLIDLAKSQAQDIAILREEVERLRLRTYPAFQV
nr:Cilia- and flagella-associated protein 43 [Polyrhizophydium stewartii]